MGSRKIHDWFGIWSFQGQIDKEMETNKQEQKHTDSSKQNKNKKQKRKLKKKFKQVCHQAFWEYVWFDGRAHTKRQSFH